MRRATTLPLAIFLLLAAPWAQAQEDPDSFPYDVLPAADPAELQQLAALSDVEFTQRLFAGAQRGRSPLLERYAPPALLVFPASHGFLGPQTACLQNRNAAACRLHVHDLTTIHAARVPGAAGRNPFAR